MASRADIARATKQFFCAQDTFKAVLFRVEENTEHGYHVGWLDDLVPQPTYLMGIPLMLNISMDVFSNNKLQRITSPISNRLGGGLKEPLICLTSHYNVKYLFLNMAAYLHWDYDIVLG